MVLLAQRPAYPAELRRLARLTPEPRSVQKPNSYQWQSVIWREPQVRYLLADKTPGGNTKLYRNYATAARDPDSREAIRLWEAEVTVVNTNEFERKKVDDKTLITRIGSDERISGTPV